MTRQDSTWTDQMRHGRTRQDEQDCLRKDSMEKFWFLGIPGKSKSAPTHTPNQHLYTGTLPNPNPNLTLTLTQTQNPYMMVLIKAMLYEYIYNQPHTLRVPLSLVDIYIDRSMTRPGISDHIRPHLKYSYQIVSCTPGMTPLSIRSPYHSQVYCYYTYVSLELGIWENTHKCTRIPSPIHRVALRISHRIYLVYWSWEYSELWSLQYQPIHYYSAQVWLPPLVYGTPWWLY